MKKWIKIMLGSLAIIGLLGWYFVANTPPTRVSARDQVPTFYLHGWGGTANSTNRMIKAAERQKGAAKVLTAKVSSTGQVTLIGNWRSQTKRPIIQVLFENNKQSHYQTTSRWFKKAIVAVNQQHHFKQFNVVAHSMGNLTLAYYLMNNAQNTKLPQLAKQVNIAGHFDGILGMDDQANQNRLKASGEPVKMNATYRQLFALRQIVPVKRLQILNIYGDLGDGSHSDGRVSNVSSQSLAYLLKTRAKSYREVKITGEKAQHSALHANKQVDHQVGQFLWGK